MVFKETERVELKRILNETFEKALVAFLNTIDGTIYIGVDDDGNIVGVDHLDDNLKKIADIITTQILPNPQENVELGAKFIDGKQIIVVDVKRGNGLYYIKKYGRSSNGCYIRMGTTSRSMTEEQIEKKYIESISIPERSIVDTPVLRDDFTFVKFKRYLIACGIHINDQSFLKNFNLVTFDGKYNILAELLADENMNSIKVAVFKGKDKSQFEKRNEYGYTCLLESLQKVLTYCDAMNETFIDLSVRPRIETRLFNSEAFKEAWINACVHNKWTEGVPPAVYWFDDRLEIVSYGGIPKNLSKQEFLAGKTEPVNKELMKIFLQCGVVEQSGHGVPIVVREYGENAYSFSDNMITVTIPFSRLVGENATVNEENATVNEKNATVNEKNATVNEENATVNEENATVNEENATVKLSKTERQIMEAMQSNKTVTIEELVALTQRHRATVIRSIKKLKDKNLIGRIGSDKKGFWVINN
jgi:predicted HTH transcriptional regulator